MSKASPTTPRNAQPRRAWKAWLPALTAALILILVTLDSEAAPKNIIVMIGDGMGPAHIDDDIFRRSEEHTSELQSRGHLVCRLLLEQQHERSQQAAGARVNGPRP